MHAGLFFTLIGWKIVMFFFYHHAPAVIKDGDTAEKRKVLFPPLPALRVLPLLAFKPSTPLTLRSGFPRSTDDPRPWGVNASESPSMESADGLSQATYLPPWRARPAAAANRPSFNVRPSARCSPDWRGPLHAHPQCCSSTSRSKPPCSATWHDDVRAPLFLPPPTSGQTITSAEPGERRAGSCSAGAATGCPHWTVMLRAREAGARGGAERGGCTSEASRQPAVPASFPHSHSSSASNIKQSLGVHAAQRWLFHNLGRVEDSSFIFNIHLWKCISSFTFV